MYPTGTMTYRTTRVQAEPSTTLLSNTNTLLSNSNTLLSNTNTLLPNTNTLLSNTNMVLSDANAVNYGQISPYSLNSSYETVRYLVPVQQPMQQSYVVVNSAPQVMPQMMSTVYLQQAPRVSVSSQEDSEYMYRQQITEHVNGNSSSVFSQSPSPIKTPDPCVEEVEVEEEEEEEEEEVQEPVKVVEEKVVEKVVERVSQAREVETLEQLVKMDTRYFGELLAEVYRKNCDIHTCIFEHVAKIRGRKHLLDHSNDYKTEKDEVEALIPRGVSELTKQQIRYLLQTRVTADKTMRLLLTTFSSLREELLHMTEDMRRLETEKESLERDLSFKADQAQQYDRLLDSVRENNRQLQASLKESNSSLRSLEIQMLDTSSSGSGQDFRIKELEGNMRALQKENDVLRQKMQMQMSSQGSSSSLQMKTDELAQQYNQQLSTLRQEKDKELEMLRSQMTRIQTEYSSERSGDRSLQLRISELLTSLEQREIVIRRQEEEIKRLQSEKSDSSRNVTKTVITKRYMNQYPLLGLLSDDYQTTSPVKEAKTIIIKTTGESMKKE